MAKSYIFEEYARIAKERGLIRTAEDPRKGSDDKKTIENIYHVLPNGEEKHIMEQAHPESVVIAPSHDKVNGLVENNIERHNIMVGIINKSPQAKLTSHKYASAYKDLNNELVRLGFFLENKKEDSLMELSDNCMAKLAFFQGLALPIIGAIVSSVGLLAVYNHFGNVSQGIRADCQKAEKQINAMISDDDYDTHDNILQIMLSNITFIREISDKIEDARKDVPQATFEEGKQLKDTTEYKYLNKLLKHFTKNCQMLLSEIPKYVEYLKSINENPNASAESDWWVVTKKLYRYIDPTDIQDLIQILEDLQSSLSSASQTIKTIRTQYEGAAKLQGQKLIEQMQTE